MMRGVPGAFLAAAALLAGCVSTEDEGIDPSTTKQIQTRIAALATLRGADLDENIEILGRFLKPHSVPLLIDAMQDDSSPQVRACCAMALGRSQDGRAVEPLFRAASGESNPGARYSAAYCLGLFRDPRGLPILFEALRSDEPGHRRKAFDGLHGLTGLDFGYRPLGTPEERVVAAERWEEWYRRLGPSGVAPLLLPGGTTVASPPPR